MNNESQNSRRVRVGIDVGGTFTDVVVIDNDSRQVISQLKVPTTHDAVEGVARGVIIALERALDELGVDASQVAFIAHSTTQATNALLEGDVAQVGIIGLGSGLETLKARIDTRVPKIELAPNRFLSPVHRFMDTKLAHGQALTNVINDFKSDGVEVVVASEAFGVDDTNCETAVADAARRQGLMATSGHEVSGLYGLRTRTRTAVLNAAILPKMIGTAEMTARCVERANITSPLMIMRSDGGVMSVEEVHRRPILTMLSGPAAGIAGALMHERVSDGIFIEVGGTSADISVIRDGQPQSRPARVGGHRTFLNTLDVRTLAIAGGSMVRERDGKIVDVGARSAHIAGLPYASFADETLFADASLTHLKPTLRDTNDYVAIETVSGARFALTPTCAANVLGIVPEDSFARGNREAARLAFAPLAEKLGVDVEQAARQVLEISCRKVVKQIEELIVEYNLDRTTLELVGGGGGAASLVLFTGELMNIKSRLARNAEVISTIGVALAMVRDTVERNIVDPTPNDILIVRRAAAEAVERAGALPETIEVQVEVDTRRNLVRATAFGTTELKKDENANHNFTFEDCRTSAARSLNAAIEEVTLAGETSALYVFSSERTERARFGFIKRKTRRVRVTDKTGVVLLQRANAEVVRSSVVGIEPDLERVITTLTDFGDAGRTLPDVYVLANRRIINLSGLASLEQALALAKTELEAVDSSERLVIIAAAK